MVVTKSQKPFSIGFSSDFFSSPSPTGRKIFIPAL